MMSRTILVVDDDRKATELIRLYLERDGYRVLVAYDGYQALDMVHRGGIDLVILDLMLPRIDGLDVCRAVRAESQLPIIMLTAKSTEADMLLGLDLGADDYITKPFSPRALMARVRAVLRRSQEVITPEPERLEYDSLAIDSRQHQVWLDKKPVHLTPLEYRLLEILIRQPGRAFSRLDLLEKAFGYDYGGLERNVDVQIMNLRKKIEPDPLHPKYIHTVFGFGYRFDARDDAEKN